MNKEFTTTDIAKLGISRELNKKWEAEGYLPGPSVKPAGGPWKAAIYSMGDIYMRAVFRKMTSRGFSLKQAASRLWDRDHPGMHSFNKSCENITSKYIAFPRISKVEPGKQFSTQIPFTDFSQLQNALNVDEHDYDDIYILNWAKIKAAVDEELRE